MMKKIYTLLIIGLALILLWPSLAKAQVYVKQGAVGDGSSWANATGDLQAAIDAAQTATVKEVRVAAGTYEAAGSDNTTRGFIMRNGVAIYGGFPNTGSPSWTDRNWKSNVTILSGGNTHRVVVNNYAAESTPLNGTAVLDGFTITNGKGSGATSVQGSGGGIYNNYASPALTNLIVTNNTSGTNYTDAWDGGGIFNDNYSVPTITNCIISNNTAYKNGGGIASQNGSPAKLFNVLITGNTAHRWGGGVFNFNLTATAVFTNVTITGNTATGNQGGGGGGGGAFSGNDGNNIVKMHNCIIWGNTGKSGQQPNIHNQSGGVHNFYNSLVQGSGGSSAWVSSFGTNSGGNIDANPQFVSVSDFSLQSTSPAINKGSDALYTGLDANTKDLAGNPRKYSTSNIDMGAYEYQGTLPVSLIGFTAKADGNRAKLQWQTASELNNQGFIIYRSGDDRQFVKIGNIPATGPASTYSYIDNTPLNGNNYYKLVQVDNDGTATELDVRTVTFSLQTANIQLYPNPVENQLIVGFETGKYSQLQLVNINGKVLQNVAINNTENSKTLAISAYPAGVYIVKLSGTTQTEIKKVVKK